MARSKVASCWIWLANSPLRRDAPGGEGSPFCFLPATFYFLSATFCFLSVSACATFWRAMVKAMATLWGEARRYGTWHQRALSPGPTRSPSGYGWTAVLQVWRHATGDVCRSRLPSRRACCAGRSTALIWASQPAEWCRFGERPEALRTAEPACHARYRARRCQARY